ncbi:MAG: acetate--CoA ligase family protein [Leptospirales bacterium]|nr:acetate--CoA ligase family protein [Leptospirales bacterium]
MSRDLQKFFYPSSVAMIGASDKIGTIPERAIRHLKASFAGNIYPINISKDEIYELKCYKSVLDIPETPDLIQIVVRAELVLDALTQGVEKGCKNFVIHSSGFGEGGDAEGIALRSKLIELAEKHNLNVLGPNSMGFVNMNCLRAAFSPTMEIGLLQGTVGIISQSGGQGFNWNATAKMKEIGTSFVVITGNEVVMNVFDIADFLLDQDDVSVICVFMENVQNGDTLIRAAKKALEKGKPLLVYKVGVTEEAIQAVAAHSGNIAGRDELFDSICNRYGIIRPMDQLQALDMVRIIQAPRGIPNGNRIGSYSNSGGGGVILTDEAVRYGLEIPKFEDKTVETLKELIPLGYPYNPVDTSAQIMVNMDKNITVVRAINTDPNVDVMTCLVGAAFGPLADIARDQLLTVFKESKIPIVVAWGGARRIIPELEVEGVPVVLTVGQLGRALGPLMRYSRIRREWLAEEKETIPQIDKQRRERGKKYIADNKANFTEFESKQLLSMYGINITKEAVAASAKDAAEQAGKIGFPVALKINSPDILHKTEAGGIKINLKNSEEVAAAYEEIIKNVKKSAPNGNYNKVLVQEMASGGNEVIVGAINDSQFGPTVMFGLGGIYVEVFKDVSFRSAPVTHKEALRMIDEIKSITILKGLRGKEKSDLNALADTIVKFSLMITELKDDFMEIDVNPLIVFPEGKGVKVVDALFVL